MAKRNPTGDTMTFSALETAACRLLVEMGLQEDLGAPGDLTSQLVIPEDLHGRAVFVARRPGVLAGLPAAALVLATVDPRTTFESHVADGSEVKLGDKLATVAGPMRSILAAERTGLNFLQR